MTLLSRPKVGFGVMLLKNNNVLLGKRHDDPIKAGSDLHGEGTWTMPGGKLEYKDKLIEGAIKEVKEETGILLRKAEVVSDNIVHDNHYVTIGFLATEFEGEAKAMEPDEIVEWKWFDIADLPDKVYPASRQLLENYLNNEVYQP